MERPKDYYAALGVSRAESGSRIQEAYRRIAKQCHPDRVGEQGTERFQEIQEAYEVLSDPRKRESYDASFSRQGQSKEVVPEPLVPSRDRSDFFRPEPLFRPSVPFPEDFASGTFSPSPWVFCDGPRRDSGFPCLFCHEFDAIESGTQQLLLKYLRAFRLYQQSSFE